MSKQFKTVKKILNGGGCLLHGLVENAARIFPRAKLISTYGGFLDLFLPDDYFIPQKYSSIAKRKYVYLLKISVGCSRICS